MIANFYFLHTILYHKVVYLRPFSSLRNVNKTKKSKEKLSQHPPHTPLNMRIIIKKKEGKANVLNGTIYFYKAAFVQVSLQVHKDKKWPGGGGKEICVLEYNIL